MSSITTAIPAGPVNTGAPGPSSGAQWCIQNLIDISGNTNEPPYTYNECANSTRGEQKTDFETFCCDGDIIDTTYNLWGQHDVSDYRLDVGNLVCCRAGGQRLMGGLSPIDSDYTHCSASYVSTPLASLAATNTGNAALYTVIYESASALASGGVGDWTVTQTPTCLWVETASSAVALATVTVPAAQITTLPPPVTDQFGNTIDYSTSTAGGSSVGSPRTAGGTATSDTQLATTAHSTSMGASMRSKTASLLIMGVLSLSISVLDLL